ncbi:MAG: SIS domain-containing protein [Candidatus Jettenia sp. CY-1]|nr:MAG: SIS domain-containing protein [Candidatus Jettenia sp. CY-1]
MGSIKRLEYRGYDSSRIAFIEDGALKYEKTVGRIAELEKKLLGNNFHPPEVEYASEFRYRNPVIEKDTIVIAISQSGETADTLAAQ